jgi:hypothetical protein
LVVDRGEAPFTSMPTWLQAERTMFAPELPNS